MTPFLMIQQWEQFNRTEQGKCWDSDSETLANIQLIRQKLTEDYELLLFEEKSA